MSYFECFFQSVNIFFKKWYILQLIVVGLTLISMIITKWYLEAYEYYVMVGIFILMFLTGLFGHYLKKEFINRLVRSDNKTITVKSLLGYKQEISEQLHIRFLNFIFHPIWGSATTFLLGFYVKDDFSKVIGLGFIVLGYLFTVAYLVTMEKFIQSIIERALGEFEKNYAALENQLISCQEKLNK